MSLGMLVAMDNIKMGDTTMLDTKFCPAARPGNALGFWPLALDLVSVDRVVNRVAGLLSACADSLAGRMCAVGKGMTRVVSGVTKITVADRLTGGIEVVLRAFARPIASGKAEHRNS
jgi:hypothetical protein